MNRQMRRSMRRQVRGAVKGEPGQVVRLHGGPMHAWDVTQTAPALQPEWGELSGYPGFRYGPAALEDGTLVSRWVPLDG